MIRKSFKFLPILGWLSPLNGGEYPFYYTPIYYCKRNGKIIMRWGLNWFYFSCLWNPKGTLERTVWFRYLYLNTLTILFLPFIVINNYLNNGQTGLIDHKIDL